jgi:hypothetical protein
MTSFSKKRIEWRTTMPNFRVTICSGVFDVEAADADEAIEDARCQADYDVEEVKDDDDDNDENELEKEDEDEAEDEDLI